MATGISRCSSFTWPCQKPSPTDEASVPMRISFVESIATRLTLREASCFVRTNAFSRSPFHSRVLAFLCASNGAVTQAMRAMCFLGQLTVPRKEDISLPVLGRGQFMIFSNLDGWTRIPEPPTSFPRPGRVCIPK